MKLENSKNSHLGRMMGSLSLGVMIFAVALAVLMNIQTTRKRVSEQTAQYIKISTMQNEQIIDRLLVDAKESIKSIGKLFGQIIDENGNVTAHDIESLNQNVSFESLIYVNKYGIGIDQDNKEYTFANVIAYYDALKGDTVIALNPLGNSDMQNRICFFAPVEKDGEIAGVLVGNFDDATLKKFMNTKLFGYTSTAFICSESGEIVANSVGILQRTTLTSYLKEHNLMDDNGIAELRNSLKNKNQYAFEIHGKNYESSAYMMRLENSGLILVQAFPVEATNKLNATANKDSWRLVTILAVFFIIYLIGTVVFNVKKQRNIMNEKESVENIVTAITQMFDRFILVDLDEDKYEYIIEDENKKLPGIGFEGSYGDILQNIFSKCFKNDEKHTSVDTMLQREKLIEQLDFEMSDDVEEVTLCSSSGALAIEGVCPHTYTEYFSKDTAPTNKCSYHYGTPKKTTNESSTEATTSGTVTVGSANAADRKTSVSGGSSDSSGSDDAKDGSGSSNDGSSGSNGAKE